MEYMQELKKNGKNRGRETVRSVIVATLFFCF